MIPIIRSRLLKILGILSFTFISIILILISKSSWSQGYELSIYQQYSWVFWSIVIVTIIMGFILLLSRFIWNSSNNNLWIIGFLIIIIVNLLILLLPLSRNYAIFPNGDALTHLGMMKDIIINGSIGSENFYPMVHIEGSFLFLILDINANTVESLMFVSWTLLLLLNFMLLAKIIFDTRGESFFICIFILPLIFSYLHPLINPAVLSIFMVPLVLFLLHKRHKTDDNRMAINILIIMNIIFITFTHPITSIFLIIILFTICAGSLLYRMVLKNRNIEYERIGFNTSNILVIGIVIFLTWYLSFAAILGSIESAFDFLFTQDVNSLYTSQVTLMNFANLSKDVLVSIFVVRYLPIFLYGLISLIISIILIYTNLRNKHNRPYYEYVYSISLLSGICFSIYSFLGFTGEFDLVRICRFFIILSPAVLGIGLYRLFYWKRDSNQSENKGLWIRKNLIFLFFMIIVIALIINVFSIYGSEYNARENFQTTSMEIDGVQWISNHHDSNTNASITTLQLKQLENYIYGLRQGSPRIPSLSGPIPTHFGYDQNSSIIVTFNYDTTYILITERDIVINSIWPEIVRSKALTYNEIDFQKLRLDMDCAQLFTNGEFEGYVVIAI